MTSPGHAQPPSPVAGIDDPGIATYGRLLEVTRRLEQIFHATITQRCGMPGPRFELLLRLGRSPGERLSVSRLAEQLGVTPGGATRLVDRVAEDGLVERTLCDTDRRVQYVRLTEAGRERLADVLAHHRRDLERELTSRFSAEEREQFESLLDRLRTPPATSEVTVPAATSRPRTSPSG